MEAHSQQKEYNVIQKHMVEPDSQKYESNTEYEGGVAEAG
jgi:hypothetical protein